MEKYHPSSVQLKRCMISADRLLQAEMFFCCTLTILYIVGYDIIHCLVSACSFLPLLPLILCLFGKHCMPLQFTLVNQSPVTYLSQSQPHAQSCSTIGQCLLYSLSLTAVSLVLYELTTAYVAKLSCISCY